MDSRASISSQEQDAHERQVIVRARILLVARKPALLAPLRRLLARRWEVECVTNGRAVLEILRSSAPDLLISELKLSGPDGLHVLRELRSNSHTRELPFILLYPPGSESACVEAFEAGADDCIKQSVAARELVARVEARLAHARTLLEERAARAAADRANEAREEIFAVLSHELRNPAAAMFEWISLLRAGRSSPAESARALDLLASTVSMQQRLLDDLRDVVRISCGSLRLRRRPLECLAPLIENCVELFQPIARKNQIRLRASVAPSMGPVDADPERIQQVLWNLLSNAVKFTPPRGRVDVRCRRVRNAVELTVRDTGCGISPEAMPHLFERFWRGGEAFEGSGLGLFIVHGIIQLHGGVVFAATEGAGLGAIFTVRLPLMARSGKGIPRNGNRTSSGDRRVRILLVEDHRATARAITRVLSCAGHTVHHESTLDDAIQAAAQGAFELLVCDLHLPGGSGLDLLPRIREFLPPSKRMATAQPAILLSGYVDEVSAARSTAAGFAISLEKPVDAAVLLAAVQEVAAE